jgi:phosphate/sulfate permease
MLLFCFPISSSATLFSGAMTVGLDLDLVHVQDLGSVKNITQSHPMVVWDTAILLQVLDDV